MLGQHSSRPRNRNIAYAFFKAGFIESWGRGYKKIRDGFEGSGLPMPKTESADGGVRVTFQRNNVNISRNDINSAKDVTKELTDRQMVIMKLIKENPFVTIPEMSRKTGAVVRIIKRYIEYLQTKGLLVREGGRKEGHWIIEI